MKFFLEAMKLDENTRILDVGGFSWHWKGLGVKAKITLLNLKPLEEETLKGNEQFTFVQGDACDMPFEDDSFDLVYSNSVIEHLYTYENQIKFAKETLRVAPRYWIQTPAKEFPVEPHLLTPFIHWFHRDAYLTLSRWFTVRSWIRDQVCPTREDAVAMAREINLLTQKEFTDLYPGSELYTEKFMGMRKSYVAYRA